MFSLKMSNELYPLSHSVLLTQHLSTPRRLLLPKVTKFLFNMIFTPANIAQRYEVELTVVVVHPNLPKCVYHKDERHFWP